MCKYVIYWTLQYWWCLKWTTFGTFQRMKFTTLYNTGGVWNELLLTLSNEWNLIRVAAHPLGDFSLEAILGFKNLSLVVVETLWWMKSDQSSSTTPKTWPVNSIDIKGCDPRVLVHLSKNKIGRHTNVIYLEIILSRHAYITKKLILQQNAITNKQTTNSQLNRKTDNFYLSFASSDNPGCLFDPTFAAAWHLIAQWL